MLNSTASAKTTPKIINTANRSPFSKLLLSRIKKIGPIAKLNRKPTGKPNINAVVEKLFKVCEFIFISRRLPYFVFGFLQEDMML